MTLEPARPGRRSVPGASRVPLPQPGTPHSTMRPMPSPRPTRHPAHALLASCLAAAASADRRPCRMAWHSGAVERYPPAARERDTGRPGPRSSGQGGPVRARHRLPGAPMRDSSTRRLYYGGSYAATGLPAWRVPRCAHEGCPHGLGRLSHQSAVPIPSTPPPRRLGSGQGGFGGGCGRCWPRRDRVRGYRTPTRYTQAQTFP